MNDPGVAPGGIAKVALPTVREEQESLIGVVPAPEQRDAGGSRRGDAVCASGARDSSLGLS